MTFPRSASSLLAALLATASLTLAGCGLGSAAGPGAATAAAPFTISGVLHGGESPIIYGKITFYETSPITVGGATPTGTTTGGVYTPTTPLTALGSTFTNYSGGFNFTTPVACSSPNNFVYATAAGGNTGAQALNPNSLLMAAIGTCSTITGGITLTINEATTIAAAYALSGFTSVTGNYTTAPGTSFTASSYTTFNGVTQLAPVNGTVVSGQPVTITGATVAGLNGTFNVIAVNGPTITIPTPALGTGGGAGLNATITPTTVTSIPTVSVVSSANNYAGVSGTGTTTSAAGLAHAFANAANLASYVGGNVYATSPSQSTAVIPSALIGTLANTLQACVNSLGGTATSSTANDGSNCGKLFSYTTNVSGATQVVPATTLQAALNMAHFPTQNVTNIFNLGSPVSAFYPSLTGAPNDLSVGIAYPRTTGGTNGVSANGVNATTACVSTATTANTDGFCYPYHLTLDANDSVYVANTNGSTTLDSNVVAITSNGATKWTTAVDLTNTQPRFIAADASGNVFLVNNKTTTPENLLEFNAGTGALEATINAGINNQLGLSIDSFDNLWLGTITSAAAQNIFEFTRSGTGAGTYTKQVPTPLPNSSGLTAAVYQLQVGPKSNVFFTLYNSTAGATNYVGVLPNSGTAAAPAYANAEITAADPGGIAAYGVTVDGNNNVWHSTATTLTPYAITYTGDTATALTAGTAITGIGTSVRYLTVDGSNTIWAVDNTSGNSFLIGYTSAATNPVVMKMRPCITNVQGGCPTPASGYFGIYGPRMSAIDSTGSAWVLSSTSGSVIQVLGTASPSWPLQSLNKPGQMP